MRGIYAGEDISDIERFIIFIFLLCYYYTELSEKTDFHVEFTFSRTTYKTQKGRLGNRPFFCYARRRILKRNRPDKDGTHRGAFEKNKKKIYATQTVCGICGKPVDFSLKYPHPLSPCIDHIIPIAKGGHPSDIDNMQLAHWTCNRQKSDKLIDNRVAKQDEILGNRVLPHTFNWSNYRPK